MTFDPSLSDPISRMRFALGDTGEPPLLPDETYEAVLEASGGDERLATAKLAGALVVRYSQEPSRVTTVSGQTVEWRDRLAAWSTLASSAAPGGTSTAGIQAHRPIRADRQGSCAEYYRGTLDREW